MKTKKYIINTYKGNLLESVKRFQNAHKNIKILEAVEDGNKLKIDWSSPLILTHKNNYPGRFNKWFN